MMAPAAKRPCPAGLSAPQASIDAAQQPVVLVDENVRALLEIISNQARRAMEPEIRMDIIPVCGFEAVRPTVTDCIRALTPFLHGLQYRKAVSIGRGAYSSVVRMEPAQGQAALTIKISKSAYPYHQVVSGHLGSDAAAYKFDDTRRVALRLKAERRPGRLPPSPQHSFTVGVSAHSVGPSGLGYVRSREGGNDDPKYHAVLFMVGGISTCEPVLKLLAEQFKAQNGMAFCRVAACTAIHLALSHSLQLEGRPRLGLFGWPLVWTGRGRIPHKGPLSSAVPQKLLWT